jgi:N6-adenosine-specific RNA methylase IME4
VKRYRTIVADPPWDYGADHGRWPSSPTRQHNQKIVHAGIPYAPMAVSEILRIPVDECAEADARLFLWSTSRHLADAFAVCTAWGFEYRQTLVWHKTVRPTPFGGSVAPNHAEFLLVAQRGNPRLLERLRSSVVSAPRPVGHSRKPDVFLDLVEQVSPGPYLELFARRARFGWDYWGDQSLGTAEMPGEAA